MAVVNKTRTYNTGDQLTSTYYNEDRDEVIAGINSIDNAQVSNSAGINESKLAFSGSGHGHTGGSDGKKIDFQTSVVIPPMTPNELVRVNPIGDGFVTTNNPAQQQRGFVFYLNKQLILETNGAAVIPVSMGLTVTGIAAYVKVPSVGASIKARVKSTDGVVYATVEIPAGLNSVSTGVVVTPTLLIGKFLQIDITQIGIATAGSFLTVMLETATT